MSEQAAETAERALEPVAAGKKARAYKQLSHDERLQILFGLREERSVRDIAKSLGRSASTISREISRCKRAPGCSGLPYDFGRACSRAFAAGIRRRKKRKLAPTTELFGRVKEHLQQGWSPAQIAGRLCAGVSQDEPPEYHQRVSHETIYTAIYALPRGELRRELVSYLRQGHVARWPRSRGVNRKTGTSGFITEPVLLGNRPPEVDERVVPGHWEGDLLKGARNQSAVGSLVERTSCFVLLAKMKDSTAHSALTGFTKVLETVEPSMRKTLTYDRGSEMAQHAQLSKNTNIAVFFCDPRAPWQRGSNENTNGLLREYLPKGTDLSIYSQGQLNAIANRLNTRPRAVLGFRTPLEVYSQLLGENLQQES